MIELILAAIAGYIGHLLEPLTREWFPDDDNNRLVSYAEGVLIIHVVFATITIRKLDWRTWWLVQGLMALSYITVGVGTVAGYVLDGLKGKHL